jgi:hypothetical protein
MNPTSLFHSDNGDVTRRQFLVRGTVLTAAASLPFPLTAGPQRKHPHRNRTNFPR